MSEVTVDGKTLYEYWGNCHCGLARYSCKLEKRIEDIPVVVCNCSKCFRAGLSNIYPDVNDVNFVRGDKELSRYYPKDNGFPHRFCPKCGVTVMVGPSDVGGPGCAINVRTFEENEHFDWNKIKLKPFDGRSHPPAYAPKDCPPLSTEGLPPLEYYFGNCHCGAARFRMGLEQPIEKTPIAICNCSLCFKIGIGIIRPKQKNLTWIKGKDQLTIYRCGSGSDEIQFCKHCGTHMGLQFTPDREDTDINVRTVEVNERFDWDRLEFCSEDGKSVDPQYVVPK